MEKEVRKAVMRGDSSEIRGLLLTDSQIDTVKWVYKKDCATAAELAKLMGVSIQNASGKLNRLYRAGYLERLTVNAKTGGIEHVYRAQEYGA